METLLRNARAARPEARTRVMIGERVYRALLFLYPRRFRREYRDQMLQLYRDAAARPRRVVAPTRRRRRRLRARPAQGGVPHHEHHKASSSPPPIATTVGIVVFAAVGGALSRAPHSCCSWRGSWPRLLRGARRAACPRGFWWKLAAGRRRHVRGRVRCLRGPVAPLVARRRTRRASRWCVGFFVFVTVDRDDRRRGLLSGVAASGRARRRLSH